jgi:hypothetical protein
MREPLAELNLRESGVIVTAPYTAVKHVKQNV